jgi:hypothetical protein
VSFFEKILITQTIMKLPTTYESSKFINVFKKAHQVGGIDWNMLISDVSCSPLPSTFNLEYHPFSHFATIYSIHFQLPFHLTASPLSADRTRDVRGALDMVAFLCTDRFTYQHIIRRTHHSVIQRRCMNWKAKIRRVESCDRMEWTEEETVMTYF